MIKYQKINHLRIHDEQVAGTKLRKNDLLFEQGDLIHISEKIDGSCASFRYLGDGEFEAYSRRKKLDEVNNLYGFYQYCSRLANHLNEFINKRDQKRTKLPPDWLAEVELLEDDITQYIFFGEWTGKKNVVEYDNSTYSNWFVFDIFDINLNEYLPQFHVDLICDEWNFRRTETIAVIPHFINWDTIKSFANINNSIYGDSQEGIVVRNESKLGESKDNSSYIVKIVNEQFHEIKHRGNLDEQQYAEKEKAFKTLSSYVTFSRVQKIIRKMQEDQEIDEQWTAENVIEMRSKVPGRVLKDIKSEEPDLLKNINNYAGKACSALCNGIINKMNDEENDCCG